LHRQCLVRVNLDRGGPCGLPRTTDIARPARLVRVVPHQRSFATRQNISNPLYAGYHPLRMKMFDHVDHFKAPSFVRIAICYIPPMFRAKAKSRFVFPDKRKRAIACPSRAICVSKRLSKAAPAPNPRNCGLDSLSVSVTLSTRIRYSVYTAWSASSLAQQTHSKRSCRASVKCHCFAGASERRRLCN
jgi:hypothetical protein